MRIPSFVDNGLVEIQGDPVAFRVLYLSFWVLFFILHVILLIPMLVDPQILGKSPELCPYRIATGKPCLGCGSLRAFSCLWRGDMSLALSYNSYALFSFSLLVGIIIVMYGIVFHKNVIKS